MCDLTEVYHPIRVIPSLTLFFTYLTSPNSIFVDLGVGELGLQTTT